MYPMNKIINIIILFCVVGQLLGQQNGAIKKCCPKSNTFSCDSLENCKDIINDIVDHPPFPINLDNDPENECIQDVTYEKGELIIKDVCNDWTIPINNNVKGTRSQIITLRNQSNLIAGCTYSISDYSRGCLAGNVECITIEAVANNEFSMDAHVSTTFDNVAWDGRYDINTNRIVELEDNRGNKANGQNGVEVDRFPWGDSQVTEVEVIKADLICDCDIEVRLINVDFNTDSYTDLRGTTGLIYYSTFSDDADTRWRNAENIRIIASTFESSTTRGDDSVDANYYRYNISDNGVDNYVGMTDALRQYGYNHGAYVYYTGGTNQWLYQTNLEPRSTIRTFSGDHRLYYTDVSSYAEYRNEAGAAKWYIYYSSSSSRAYVRNYNTNFVRYYAVITNSRGEINTRDAIDQRIYYTTVADYSIVNMTGTANIIYGSNIMSQSRFNASGGNHYRLTLAGLRTINAAFNTRSVYGFGAGTNTLTAPNTNKGVDYFNNSLI